MKTLQNGTMPEACFGLGFEDIHNDVERLMEWLAVEKNEQGLIFTPYAEIVLDVHLPNQRVA